MNDVCNFWKKDLSIFNDKDKFILILNHFRTCKECFLELCKKIDKLNDLEINIIKQLIKNIK